MAAVPGMMGCSKCGATNDGTQPGVNPCHLRSTPEDHSFIAISTGVLPTRYFFLLPCVGTAAPHYGSVGGGYRSLSPPTNSNSEFGAVGPCTGWVLQEVPKFGKLTDSHSEFGVFDPPPQPNLVNSGFPQRIMGNGKWNIP